jgi:hypothetical protein
MVTFCIERWKGQCSTEYGLADQKESGRIIKFMSVSAVSASKREPLGG